MKLRKWFLSCLLILGLGLAILLAFYLVTGRRHSPEVILGELEQLTPLGSTIADVESAIGKWGLHRGEGGLGGTIAKDGTKLSIIVRYADSLVWTVPPQRKMIQANWHFGPDGKLNDISLDYYQGGYMGFSSDQENDKPIRLSDYRKLRTQKAAQREQRFKTTTTNSVRCVPPFCRNTPISELLLHPHHH
jgi:hypothetical protein